MLTQFLPPSLPGEDSQTVSYQLVGQHTNGISKVRAAGPFRFSGVPRAYCKLNLWGRAHSCASRKKMRRMQPTISVSHCYLVIWAPPPHEMPAATEPDLCLPATTPWIALVSCDANSTNASQDVDIFTLAMERGAVGAVCICFSHAYTLRGYLYLFRSSSSIPVGQAPALSIPGIGTLPPSRP